MVKTWWIAGKSVVLRGHILSTKKMPLFENISVEN
jgi:hypothetical protein